ncbi:Aquaporin-1 [Oleoguttula sp. CCFEE 5521]
MNSSPVKEVVVEKSAPAPAPAANNVVVEKAAAPAADKVVVEKAAPNAVVVEKPAAVVAPAPAVVVAPPMTMNTNPPVVDKFVALPGTSQPAVVAVAPTTGAVVAPAATTVVVEEKRPVMTSHPKRKRSWFKEHFIAYLGELIGTFMFLTLAFAGTQIALDQNNAVGSAPASLGVLAYIALVFGFSLTVTAWIFYRVTGGMFNPAVTLGLMLIGALSWSRAFVVFWAQMIGALLAGGFVDLLLPGPLTVVTHFDNDSFGALRAVFLEAFLTFMLIMTIFFLAVEKHRGTFLAPLAIGLTLFVAELVGVRYTGGSLNPARSFGAQVWAMRGACNECGDDAGKWDGHWVYWVGPLIGALAAVLFYRILKALEYEIYGDVGQDADRPQPADDDDDDVVIDPAPGNTATTTTTSNGPAAQPLPRGMV